MRWPAECCCAQASLSQLSALASGSAGVTLLQELTGFLRRSLSQQAAVRETLYKVEPPPSQGPALESVVGHVRNPMHCHHFCYTSRQLGICMLQCTACYCDVRPKIWHWLNLVWSAGYMVSPRSSPQTLQPQRPWRGCSCLTFNNLQTMLFHLSG
jgi:hypothetical protein